MKLRIYLIKINNSYSLQNNLQKDIYAYLKSIDRQVIDIYQLRKVKSDILKTIEDINKKHVRCKAIEAHWNAWKDNQCDEDDHHLQIGHGIICNLTIYSGDGNASL
jgi:hypothetical protein